MHNPVNKTTRKDFQRILSAIETFRRHDRSESGIVFTDNWYDSHPRLLIFDPVLNPYDKLVWLTIRSFCAPDMSLASFPSYDQIQSSLHISRATVSSSITKLRATRWITLLCRERVRNSAGQFVKDGNIYLVHGEPLGLSDTFAFDSNYMEFLQECKKHRNSDARKISELIVNSIRHDIDHDDDIFEDRHPFDRRIDAWASVQGDSDARFFGNMQCPTQTEATQQHYNPNIDAQNHPSTVVHQTNYGEFKPVVHDVNRGDIKPVVHDVNYGAETHKSTVVSSNSSSKSNNYYNNYKTGDVKKQLSSDELVYPSSLSDNQKHLIELHLQRLPESLPSPPEPWTNWSQLLLDELDGRIQIGDNSKCDAVWNPVSLMSAYCQRLITSGIGLKEDGQFQVEHAESVLQKRKKKANHKKAYEDAYNRYRQRTINRARDARTS